jgi:hypothetical protein
MIACHIDCIVATGEQEDNVGERGWAYARAFCIASMTSNPIFRRKLLVDNRRRHGGLTFSWGVHF